MISNQKPLSYINQLLQLGLINNQKKISYGRIVMQDPDQGVKSMVYRDLAVEIFNKLIDYCLNDAVMYNRLRQLLSDRPMKEDAFNCLVEKAEKVGVDLFLVLEKYDEGYKQDYPMHLTREQRAFNHVNAFLAECRVEIDPNHRQQGTEELTNLYKDQTPGQSKLKTIKKALRK